MSVEQTVRVEQLTADYRLMLLIRRCEEAIGRLLNEGLVHGTAHLSIGQEAVPVGFSSELTGDDYLTTTYRGHGWALAKGVDLTGFFAELFGRETGVCRGRGGSMHLCDMGVGLIGASGIVGGGLPIAAGAAWAAQVHGTDQVAIASFGDAATNIGTFHESVNFAAVWQLPVVFVCENNLYGEFTPARETCLLTDFADRASAYGIPGVVVDGNDVAAVRAVAAEAIERARGGGGPTLVEAKTYRHRGHSRNDPGTYRPESEVAAWLLRDPLVLARERLAQLAGWDDESERELAASVDAEIAGAVAAASEGAFPDPGALGEHVYAALADSASDVPRPVAAGEPRSLTYREAVREGLAEELRRDPSVVFFGEDVAAAGGVFKVTAGLQEEFGAERVRDTPISENALVGMAIGAAAGGLRPVVEIMFADFLANAFDQLVNHAAKLRYMSGGQLELPLVVRSAHGGGIGFAAQHSQAATSWLLPFPGIKIVAPSTPDDAKRLLQAAIRDPNPVLFLEHKALYGAKGSVAADGPLPVLGVPLVRRAGGDVTILALAGTVARALAAAELVAAEGTECEVIDLRCLVPLDDEPLVASLRRTGRLLVVEEEPAQGGWAGAVVARLVQSAWPALKAAPCVVSGPNVPIPYGPVLEQAYQPSAEAIAAAARGLGAGV